MSTLTHPTTTSWATTHPGRFLAAVAAAPAAAVVLTLVLVTPEVVPVSTGPAPAVSAVPAPGAPTVLGQVWPDLVPGHGYEDCDRATALGGDAVC